MSIPLVLKTTQEYYQMLLHACIQTMRPIIMICYIRNVHIICDRFQFPTFNKSILIIVILFIRGIVSVFLRIIFRIINVLSIIAITSIVALIFFFRLYSCSYGWSVYTYSDRHNSSFILLVL